MQDSLDKLQLKLIDLEYAIAEIVYQIEKMKLLRPDDLFMLQQHARILDITAHNLVQFTYSALNDSNYETAEQN